ncbi:MAG: flavodoxin [Anaerofustis stercorihominis]|nr:flavodoxin [Anaerofustis stercorihominis]
MKTAIVYYSYHHGNTKKVVEAIKNKFPDVTLIDAKMVTGVDLGKYDLIGFASGIYAGKFHKSVLDFAEKNLTHNKNVFLIYTYASSMNSYTKAIMSVLSEKNAVIKGTFGCTGYNTFGPFKLIGGTGKNRPDENDLKNAVEFYENLL